MSLKHRFTVELPAWMDGWVGHWLNQRGAQLDSPERRMSLAVGLALENVRRETGGPFAALVVQSETGQLLGAGVNLVTSQGLSLAHAEMVALSLAQRAAGTWNLGDSGPVELVTSCEPCAMCFGAIPWSGVSAVVCGARREDAEAAGFDEGDKPADWAGALRRRGIGVTEDVMRDEAAGALRDYAARAGAIYNPGRFWPSSVSATGSSRYARRRWARRLPSARPASVCIRSGSFSSLV